MGGGGGAAEAATPEDRGTAATPEDRGTAAAPKGDQASPPPGAAWLFTVGGRFDEAGRCVEARRIEKGSADEATGADATLGSAAAANGSKKGVVVEGADGLIPGAGRGAEDPGCGTGFEAGDADDGISDADDA